MTTDLTNFKTPVFPNINDTPIAPTSTKAGNGADLINRLNGLIDELQTILDSLEITISDESSELVTKLRGLNFIGEGVTATNQDGIVTVTVPGASTGSGNSNNSTFTSQINPNSSDTQRVSIGLLEAEFEFNSWGMVIENYGNKVWKTFSSGNIFNINYAASGVSTAPFIRLIGTNNGAARIYSNNFAVFPIPGFTPSISTSQSSITLNLPTIITSSLTVSEVVQAPYLNIGISGSMNANSSGNIGDFRIASDAIYICTSNNQWKKIPYQPIDS